MDTRWSWSLLNPFLTPVPICHMGSQKTTFVRTKSLVLKLRAHMRALTSSKGKCKLELELESPQNAGCLRVHVR